MQGEGALAESKPQGSLGTEQPGPPPAGEKLCVGSAPVCRHAPH